MNVQRYLRLLVSRDKTSASERENTPELPDDPSRVSQRTNEICTEICALQSTSLCSSNIQRSLEFCIEHIKQAVGKPCSQILVSALVKGKHVMQLTPQEEKYSDKRDWEDRLSDCQGRSTCETTIRDRFAVLIRHGFNG